jgi:hypothetical protein
MRKLSLLCAVLVAFTLARAQGVTRKQPIARILTVDDMASLAAYCGSLKP